MSQNVSLSMNSFLSSTPITIFFLLSMWSVNKNVQFYKRQPHSCVQVMIYQENDGFISVISFLHDIQSQPLKWLNCVVLNLQELQTENKVTRHKDTVENWSSVTCLWVCVCLCPTSKNTYFRQSAQPSSNGNSCIPFISCQ